jgi:hypothetical protein
VPSIVTENADMKHQPSSRLAHLHWIALASTLVTADAWSGRWVEVSAWGDTGQRSVAYMNLDSIEEGKDALGRVHRQADAVKRGDLRQLGSLMGSIAGAVNPNSVDREVTVLVVNEAAAAPDRSRLQIRFSCGKAPTLLRTVALRRDGKVEVAEGGELRTPPEAWVSKANAVMCNAQARSGQAAALDQLSIKPAGAFERTDPLVDKTWQESWNGSTRPASSWVLSNAELERRMVGWSAMTEELKGAALATDQKLQGVTPKRSEMDTQEVFQIVWADMRTSRTERGVDGAAPAPKHEPANVGFSADTVEPKAVELEEIIRRSLRDTGRMEEYLGAWIAAPAGRLLVDWGQPFMARTIGPRTYVHYVHQHDLVDNAYSVAQGIGEGGLFCDVVFEVRANTVIDYRLVGNDCANLWRR